MESPHGIQLTVVIPVYNCAGWVLPKLDQLVAYFSGQQWTWELIVVDDGSKDGTPEVIRKHLKGLESMSLLELPRNMGKGAAVLAGLRGGHGAYRLFMDCDLAYPLTEATKLIEALERGADVAVANRRMADSICELKPGIFRQVYSRELYGRVLNSFVRSLGLASTTDTQAGLKAMRARLVDCLDVAKCSRFAFDIEMLYLAERSGADIKSIAVRYQYFNQESTVAVFRDGSRLLFDILRIKYRAINGYYGSAFSRVPIFVQPRGGELGSAKSNLLEIDGFNNKDPHVSNAAEEAAAMMNVINSLCPSSFLDIGTGSGYLAVTSARNGVARVDATDVDEHALEVARENARRYGADVRFIRSDLLQHVDGSYDVIAFNPPLIPSKNNSPARCRIANWVRKSRLLTGLSLASLGRLYQNRRINLICHLLEQIEVKVDGDCYLVLYVSPSECEILER